MPLPTKEPVAFRGVPSLGAEKKMALSMTLTQKQVEAMFARQAALQEQGSNATSYPLEIDFDENKIYIGNIATKFTRFKEDGTREICQRSPTVSKPLAPISLSGNVIGKLNIYRDFDQDVADNVRKATEAEHSKRNERTIVVLDTPPTLPHTKKGRSGASASTLAKKAMSNRLVSAQAASTRLQNPPIISKPSIPASSSSVSRPKPPTSNKPTPPSSRSVSASAKLSTPFSSNPSSSTSTSKEPDLTSLRAHLTHFIALDPRTTQEVLLEVGGRSPTPDTVREIEDTLTAVAQEIQPPKKGPIGPVKWELHWRSWEQVRPYDWPDITTDQRTRLARKGRLALSQMNLPLTDPLWEHFQTRVQDTNSPAASAKGKTKAAPGQTLLKNSDFRGGVYSKEKKPSTKGDGVVTKAKSSTSKSKAKKDREEEVETKVRKVLAADTKDKAKGNAVSSTAGSVPTTRIPKKRKQENDFMPPSSKPRTSNGSSKRDSSPPPSKYLRIQDEGGRKRKLSEVDLDVASEMEEGELPVESDVKKRKISDIVGSTKPRLSNTQTGNGDLPVKKSVKEKKKVAVKEESLPPKLVKDVTCPRVSVASSSSRGTPTSGKAQKLEKEEMEQDTRDMDRLKEREREKRRSNGKRGRRPTPSFSSDSDEEEEEPKKVPVRASASAVSKPRASQHPPSSKLAPLASKVTSRVPAPSPVLPSDKEALRRRYHTYYAEYMGVTSKFYEQRAKVEALLATDVDSVSADDNIEMMDTEELIQLRGEHERLRDELQRIQHAHASGMVF